MDDYKSDGGSSHVDQYQSQTEASPIPPRTAEIHVSFKQFEANGVAFDEAVLLALFSRYGNVLTVAIKKLKRSKDTDFSSGFGFVHYLDTPEGYECSLLAVRSLPNEDVDGVNYRCFLTHKLEAHLLKLNYDLRDLQENSGFMYSNKISPGHNGMNSNTQLQLSEASTSVYIPAVSMAIASTTEHGLTKKAFGGGKNNTKHQQNQQQRQKYNNPKQKSERQAEMGYYQAPQRNFGRSIESGAEGQRWVNGFVNTSRLFIATQGLFNSEAGVYGQSSTTSSVYIQEPYPPRSPQQHSSVHMSHGHEHASTTLPHAPGAQIVRSSMHSHSPIQIPVSGGYVYPTQHPTTQQDYSGRMNHPSIDGPGSMQAVSSTQQLHNIDVHGNVQTVVRQAQHSSQTAAQLMPVPHSQAYSTSSVEYGAVPASPTRYAPLRQRGGPTYDPSVRTRGAVAYRGVVQQKQSYNQHPQQLHPYQHQQQAQPLQQLHPAETLERYGDRYVHSHGHGWSAPQHGGPMIMMDPSARSAVSTHISSSHSVSPHTQPLILDERYYSGTIAPEFSNSTPLSAYAHMSPGQMVYSPYVSPAGQYSVVSPLMNSPMGSPMVGQHPYWYNQQCAPPGVQGHSYGHRQQQRFNSYSYASTAFANRSGNEQHRHSTNTNSNTNSNTIINNNTITNSNTISNSSIKRSARYAARKRVPSPPGSGGGDTQTVSTAAASSLESN
jgi:hypothetical protein